MALRWSGLMLALFTIGKSVIGWPIWQYGGSLILWCGERAYNRAALGVLLGPDFHAWRRIHLRLFASTR